MEKWLEVSVKVNHEAEEVTAEILGSRRAKRSGYRGSGSL